MSCPVTQMGTLDQILNVVFDISGVVTMLSDRSRQEQKKV